MTRVTVGVVGFGVILFSVAGSAQTARSATPSLALESLTGRDSFDGYCSACHGVDGRGAGPVASALKTRPPDLTALAERNGGSFPRERIVSLLEGTAGRLPAHGTSEMPVWGSLFRALEPSDARVRVRLANLVAYVESLQRPADTLPRSAESTQSGAQLFRTYCAACHGETARGAGPLSVELTRPVPDLTTFAMRNGGVFPGERLRQMIEGRGPAAHGDRTMPVWGAVFSRQAPGTDDAAARRIDALVTFLQSIQQRGAE